MKKLLLGALLPSLLLVGAGCRSNPYCLNCKDGGNGVLAPVDLAGGGATDDLAGGGDVVDMASLGNGCIPSNKGIEICDGLDNDCNGTIDDVGPAQLLDPNNCGTCGHVCKFPNAFGVCTADANGTPQCSQGMCEPGHVDLDKNPANGCEYACVVSNKGVEICDLQDNDCDGDVDEDFTTRWSDAAHQKPLYDKETADCGACGALCKRPNASVACVQPDTMNPKVGACVVTACDNKIVTDASGSHHETYRHDTSKGDINKMGCEYHCPSPATEVDKDCENDGACTFPAEVCNAKDDDCNFLVDDKLTDPGLGGRCPDGTINKLCSDTLGNCRAPCDAGTLACSNGALVCKSSKGPSADVCDGVDNDCDGKIDNAYTATWAPDGSPRYDSDTSHCGGCDSTKFTCKLANATNGCNLKPGDTLGSCYVSVCNTDYYYVKHLDSSATNPTCDINVTGAKDSTQATPGVGCNYKCANPPGLESCDNKDNDCDGCIDNGLTPPKNLCATKGVCQGQAANIKITCGHAAGWSCDYTNVPNVSVDSSGNLKATELQCDNRDNNCNGNCDENFPGVLVNASSPEGVACSNPHAATNCKAGTGVCQASGPIQCAKSDPAKLYNDVQACSAVANTAAATDEICNGKDDDCNGKIDEPTTAMVGNKTLNGWHDPVATVQVPDYPTATLGACTDPTSPKNLCLQHTVYVYQYEATRPDALATAVGSSATRACSNAGVLPWNNVTYAQAAAACARIQDLNGNSIGRLCTAWEWQQTCSQLATSGDHWSMSTATTSYASGVCNDGNLGDQRCLGGVTCAKSCNAANQCTCSVDGDCASGYKCSGGVCTAAGYQRCTGNAMCRSNNCNGSGQCKCTTDADCSPGYGCGSGGVCIGAGAWPTGISGPGSATGNQCYTTSGSDQVHDMTGNLMEWTSTPVILRSGSAAKITAVSAGQATVGGLTGFTSSDVGVELVLSGATNAGNNGTFLITSFIDAATVTVANANAVVESPATGAITWQFIYRKLRGGAYSSTQPAGMTCEFDIDLQRATFVNADLGFRCCSDVKP